MASSNAANSCQATGSCTCVGFVGGTLGGGVGRYQGIHGLIIDNLLSVNLITAVGDQITVSATENTDLFWGIRGAGMNFGVITSATYKVADQTNGGQVQDADFVFTASQNVSFFNALASLQGTLPPELSLLTYVDYNATNGGVSQYPPSLLQAMESSDKILAIIDCSSSQCRISGAYVYLFAIDQTFYRPQACGSSGPHHSMESPPARCWLRP